METHHSSHTKSEAFEKYSTPIALFAGLALIAGALYYGDGAPSNNGAPGTNPPATTGTEGAAVNVKDVKQNTSPSFGNPNAPVTMAYWFDYQCPFCGRFDSTIMTRLNDEYIKTGKLRVIVKDFQFLGPDSETAGLFARAVWEAYPNQFYAWFQMMFENQDEEHGGFGDLPSIVAATNAAGLGIDTTRIEQMITTNKAKYLAALTADQQEGAKFGVQGTPSMIIGTTFLPGLPSYDAVKKAIDAELTK